MNKTESLRNGESIVLREMTGDDLDALYDFFRSLPEEDRRYFRTDVTDKERLARKIGRVEAGEELRVLALDGDRVVGQGSLELPVDDWKSHQAEMRAFVARDYRRRGLGMALMRELYLHAVRHGVESLVVKMMRPQVAARQICRRLGFHEEHVLPDYVRDRTGAVQDLVLMSCKMDEIWHELEELYHDTDPTRLR
jgi:L-amino acid N-acyltransferase YncA